MVPELKKAGTVTSPLLYFSSNMILVRENLEVEVREKRPKNPGDREEDGKTVRS